MNAPGREPWRGSARLPLPVTTIRRKGSIFATQHAAGLPISAVTFDVGGTLRELCGSVGEGDQEEAVPRVLNDREAKSI